MKKIIDNKIVLRIKNIHVLGKRQKIIITSIILSFGLLYTQLVPIYLTYHFIFGLSVLALLLSIWALWEGLSRLKAMVLLILPTLFTLAVAGYYYLLPVVWLTRFSVAAAFGLSFYCLLLSQNVFNVSSIRTIPLYRAASTVAFTFTLITAFLLFNVILSFEMIFFWNGVAVFLLCLPLILQVLWSIEMEGVNSQILLTGIFLSLVLGEIGLALSFWPLSGPMASLILSTVLYVVLGIMTHSIRDRLSKNAVYEYIVVGAVVFLVAMFTTSWTG